MPRRVRFTEEELRGAIASSRSWSQALRLLHYRSAGGNWLTLKKYAALWKIPTDHFDPDAVRREAVRPDPTPLAEILVAGSTYSRGHLKRRLFREGIKERRCELCGQGEIWRGERMALILDHTNGVPNDNRIENLRIVCPNCAATFKTHCGRKNQTPIGPRTCERCRKEFHPSDRRQRYCSRYCGMRWDRSGRAGGRALLGVAKPQIRKARRPPYEQLLREIEETSYLAVGRRYGVSDNAVRKWVRFYENERSRIVPETEPLEEAA